MQSFLKVSVPFPGILFLNIAMLTRSQKRKFVSVPFPGILFLNVRTLVRNTELSRVSVPFPGILFLNYIPAVVILNDGFPSPSRGSYFSIDDGLDYADEMHGFRPLPGDLISQLIGVVCIISWCTCTVSVPFPGILFLNPVLYMPDLNWIPKPNCGAKPNPTLE